MKKNIVIIAAMLAGVTPVLAQRTVQRVPESVKEIVVGEATTLTVVEDTASMLVVERDVEGIARLKGEVLYINSNVVKPTLRLKHGQSLKLTAEDAAQVKLTGTFDFGDTLMIHAYDASKVIFETEADDTIHCMQLVLGVHDAALIDGSVYIDSKHSEMQVSEYGKLWVIENEWQKEKAGSKTVSKAVEHLAEASQQLAENLNVGSREQSTTDWDFNIDFAWGFNNWFAADGFDISPVEGSANARTSFSNVQLSFNFPIIKSRYMSFYAGLGLEWDKYHFEDANVYYAAGSGTNYKQGGFYTDVTNAVGVTESRLNTRHVVFPLTLKFTNGPSKNWQVWLSAIPGVAYTGNYTGLRYETNNGKYRDKLVNKAINPLMLDVRLTFKYEKVGFYIQAATLPVLYTDGITTPDLCPLKFGIII